MPDISLLLNALEYCKPSGTGKWIARCPAHDDKSPSLSITQRGERILIHCHAGCGGNDILDAVGLDYSAIYPEPTDNNYYNSSKPRRNNSPSYDELLLAITKDSRASGGQLTKAEEEAELAAFMRQRSSN